MPCVLDFEQTELIVFHDISKKASSMKSRKNAINDEKGNNEDESNRKCRDDKENKRNETEGKKSGEDLQRNVTRTGIGKTKTVEIEQMKQMITKNLNRRKLVAESQLISFFMPLSFATVIHLIELLPKKRKQTTFLLETLGKQLEELLPKRNKKIPIFLVCFVYS
ncbi:unnamed protein product [Onchocerca flexuosa]|uniref:Uncharacterized protein n=1 Tax=Onchocerca flexuosa TaxID=387005 RepID=A0A183HR09_9BILA|nr:unnamed protein product [Onchocerca flexuosa]